jgi:hypothetical protein
MKWSGVGKVNAMLRENRIASGVKFIAACDVFSYTVLILHQMRPGKIAKARAS